MSMICKVLCCCCYYLCDSTPPSEDSSPLLNPNDHSLNTPKVDNPVIQIKAASREGYHSFSSPPRRKPTDSKSVTPDSACAYGDGETYQGAVTAASPNKSKYGALSPHDYV